MPILRSDCDTVLSARTGGWLAEAGLSAPGAFDDPLARSARRLGVSLASPATIGDPELAYLAVADTDEFLDIAEYFTLATILQQLRKTTSTALDRSEAKSDLIAAMQTRLDGLYALLRDSYGFGGGTLSAGTVDLGYVHGRHRGEW